MRVTTRPQCRPAQKLPGALVTRSSHPELVTQCTEKATRDARKWPCDLTRLSNLDNPSGEAFCAELDRIVRANFTGDYWDITLPNRLDTSSSRSPALSAYWAALNLLDAELLFSDMKVKELLDPHITPP